LHHYRKQGFKAAEVAKKICKVEEKDVVSISTEQKWFKRSTKDT